MKGSIKTKVIIGSLVIIAALSLMLVWNPEAMRSVPAEKHKPLILYCAAGIKTPVEKVVKEYEANFGVPIKLQYGGSGTLLSNLRISQFGDLYLAGDSSFIEIARKQGLVAEAIPLSYIRPVIVVAKGNPKNIHSANDLLRRDVRIALGNPEAAAVGKQTREVLLNLGLWEEIEDLVRKRGVFKPTVEGVANDIKLGIVDAGVIWDATERQYPELEIGAALTDDKTFVMEVTIGVLTSCRRPADALHFARYLAASDRGLREFARYGYTPVDGDIWEENPEILLMSGGVNRPAIEGTIRAFEMREGCRVIRVYNGCGILVAQMMAGERPDAYFACDISFMNSVQDLFFEAINISETEILIAVQKGNPRNIQSLEDLTIEGLKLGVANAKQSALGALTVLTLQRAGLQERVMHNVVSQTPTADLLVNQLRTGSLDAVIVYEANIAHVSEHLDIVRVDAPSAKAIQPFAVLKNSKFKHLTRRLLAAIQSADSRERYLQTGFRWLVELE